MAAFCSCLVLILVVEFGTSETVFAFLFLLFIRPRRLYTYKLQKLARRQDMQHIRKKDTCTLHYAPAALLACSADFLLVSGIASHRTAFICACLRSLAIITMQSHQHRNSTLNSSLRPTLVHKTVVKSRGPLYCKTNCFSSTLTLLRQLAPLGNSHALLTLFCSWLLFPVSPLRHLLLKAAATAVDHMHIKQLGLLTRLPPAGEGEYMDDQHHHHHQAPPAQPGPGGDDVRQAHVFHGGFNGGYGSNAPASSSTMPSLQDTLSNGHHPVAARRAGSRAAGVDEPSDLFPDIPEAKKRKFILVEDSDRQSRLRVRVTLDGVDTREIPDSFRKSSSVFPRSYFPREMQSPPPSATGSRFFQEDMSDVEDDGNAETEGRRAGRGAAQRGRSLIKVPATSSEGSEVEVAIPKLRKAIRGKEVRLNDLGYRMAWLQSRVFAGRPVFLQRALDCYRNKTRQAIDSIMQDVKTVAPHYETRVGKRRWTEKTRRGDKKDDES